MNIDLNAMSKQELQKLLRDIDKAIADYDNREKRKALAELEAHARGLGFNLLTLVESNGQKSVKATMGKYANPDDPSMMWSGRGRQPAWFKAALANGMTPDALAV